MRIHRAFSTAVLTTGALALSGTAFAAQAAERPETVPMSARLAAGDGRVPSNDGGPVGAEASGDGRALAAPAADRGRRAEVRPLEGLTVSQAGFVVANDGPSATTKRVLAPAEGLVHYEPAAKPEKPAGVERPEATLNAAATPKKRVAALTDSEAQKLGAKPRVAAPADGATPKLGVNPLKPAVNERPEAFAAGAQTDSRLLPRPIHVDPAAAATVTQA